MYVIINNLILKMVELLITDKKIAPQIFLQETIRGPLLRISKFHKSKSTPLKESPLTHYIIILVNSVI